jgi:hypothetical protein
MALKATLPVSYASALKRPRRIGLRTQYATIYPATCHRVRPNPSLSPRPATAGQLARVARWFMLHHAGKPSCLRGRG